MSEIEQARLHRTLATSPPESSFWSSAGYRAYEKQEFADWEAEYAAAEAAERAHRDRLSIRVPCPTCHALAGAACRTPSGKPAAQNHAARYTAAQRIAKESR